MTAPALRGAAPYRALLVLPVVAAAAVVILNASVTDAATLDRLYFYEGTAMKLLAAAGAVLAALRFGAGDYLRGAWWLWGISYALLVGKDLAYGRDTHIASAALPAASEAIRAGVVLVSNAAAVVSAALFARAFSVAGLTAPGSRAHRTFVVGIVAIVALAVVGPAAWHDLRAGMGGDWHGYGNFASDLGDLLVFWLIAPVLLTALALRGGLLVWPWALMTASNAGWLLFDATGTIGSLVNAPDAKQKVIEELCRAVACTLALAAGLAQRWVTQAE